MSAVNEESPLTGAAIIAMVAGLVDLTLHPDQSGLPWADVGVDSFTSTELLIQVEHAHEGLDPARVEEAFFSSRTADELAAALVALREVS